MSCQNISYKPTILNFLYITSVVFLNLVAKNNKKKMCEIEPWILGFLHFKVAKTVKMHKQ
jgi:hypothetical protein